MKKFVTTTSQELCWSLYTSINSPATIESREFGPRQFGSTSGIRSSRQESLKLSTLLVWRTKGCTGIGFASDILHNNTVRKRCCRQHSGRHLQYLFRMYCEANSIKYENSFPWLVKLARAISQVRRPSPAPGVRTLIEFLQKTKMHKIGCFGG